MSIKIETPPNLSGATEAQLRQMYSYLYRLSEHLNVALGELSDKETAVKEALQAGRSGPSASDFKKLAGSYNELRALIVNTAEIIRSEMDTVQTTMQGKYEAISSQWGTFQENFQTTVTETAREVVREYEYDGAITTLQEQAAGFESYRLKTEGYIRQGFIAYDDNGAPILGIAIGQGLKGTAVTIDGVEYEQFDSSQSCAFYTAEKVSFRINGQEVAYVSNRRLYIGDMEVTGTVTMNDWMITSVGGFALKYIGGGD